MVARETWMTELPPELQHIGLGLAARTFKKKAGPENKDRSMWTDTPAERERKLQVGTPPPLTVETYTLPPSNR